MSVSIEIFKVHTFFNMSTTPQAFFFNIILKRTLCYEKGYKFHFSTMICVGITTSVAFILSTTVHFFHFGYSKNYFGFTFLSSDLSSCTIRVILIALLEEYNRISQSPIDNAFMENKQVFSYILAVRRRNIPIRNPSYVSKCM